MEQWHDFFVANAGASAALAGLVFVGISINLDRIIQTAGLADRGLEALVPLVVLLIVSILALLPEQRNWVFGLVTLVVGLCSWALLTRLIVRFAQRHPPDTRQTSRSSFIARVVLVQAATLPFMIAGVTLFFWDDRALYILAVGTIGSYLLAFADAWVLLVEIDR
jgi:hypothetical protein